MFKKKETIWLIANNNIFHKSKIKKFNNTKKEYLIETQRCTKQGKYYKQSHWVSTNQIKKFKTTNIEIGDKVTIKNNGDIKNPDSTLYGYISLSKIKHFKYYLNVKGCKNNKKLSGYINDDNIIKIQKKFKKKKKKFKNSKSKIQIQNNKNMKIKTNSTIINKKLILNNPPKSTWYKGLQIKHRNEIGTIKLVTLLYPVKIGKRTKWRYLWPDDGYYKQEFRKGWIY